MMAEVGHFKLNLMDIPGNTNNQSQNDGTIVANSAKKLAKVSTDPAEVAGDKKNNGPEMSC